MTSSGDGRGFVPVVFPSSGSFRSDPAHKEDDDDKPTMTGSDPVEQAKDEDTELMYEAVVQNAAHQLALRIHQHLHTAANNSKVELSQSQKKPRIQDSTGSTDVVQQPLAMAWALAKYQLYPELYSSVHEAQEAQEKYQTLDFYTLGSSTANSKLEDSNPRKKRAMNRLDSISSYNSNAENSKADLKNGQSTSPVPSCINTEAAVAPQPPILQASTSSIGTTSLVPDAVECPLCGRSQATTRFTLHLDKCLGLGNTTRTNNNPTIASVTTNKPM
jgi:Sgf11 (transcriptional regulation protein)